MKVQDREVVKTSCNTWPQKTWRAALSSVKRKTFQRHYGLSLGKPIFWKTVVVDVFAPDIECGFERHSFKGNIPLMFFVRLYVRQEMMSDRISFKRATEQQRKEFLADDVRPFMTSWKRLWNQGTTRRQNA